MLLTICTRAIEYLFYLLFFLVPLIFLPVNYELFEFNKIILTYAFTALIGGFWAIKMILQGRIRIQRTPLDIPILLFLASQIISTIVSIDIHTSVWGYYSRFNGGLASIISYIFLYYAFVSNFSRDKMQRLLIIALASGTLVATYGVLERLGIDKDFWVQDVQNRVFSTLGQPNWLAAYLSVIIFISIGLFLPSKYSIQIPVPILRFPLPTIFTAFGSIPTAAFIITLLYPAFLFTKSRSGFLGLFCSLAFLIIFLWITKKWRLQITSVLLTLLIVTFMIGAPFEQLNQFTLPGIRQENVASTNSPGPALEVGGTESGEIRRIVWKGALDIAKAYPLFGSGVETFAYSYYKFRPVEHNMTSEWDFLYNKAHNEYLNYLANTGLFGLGSYLLMIGMFLWITIRRLMMDSRNLKLDFDVRKSKIEKNKLKLPASNFNNPVSSFQRLTSIGLLTGYISILVSNFFGFSVVIVNIFFFLIPAMVFVLTDMIDPEKAYVFPTSKQKLATSPPAGRSKLGISQWVLIVFILFTIYYLLFTIFSTWDADRNYALGRSLNKSGDYSSAYSFLVSAIGKRPGEPQFSEELSLNTAALAVAALEANESTLSSQLVHEAIRQSDYTVKKGPNNPNYWRTRIRVFYTLSQIDPTYNKEALAAAKKASELSPTDPKIAYNYGLILGQGGKLDEAIAELERTIKLKPDYRDPIYALGLFYHEKATDEKGKVINQEYLQKAIAQMEAVLKLASDDAEAKEKLSEWKKL